MGVLLLLLEGLGHSAQPHGAQLLDGGLYQHSSSLSLTGGLFTGVEGFRAANVGVVERRLWLGRRLDLLAVQMALQNRFDALVGTSMERDGAARGRLHSLARVLLGEPQNAEAGALALFRGALAGDDAIKQFGGRRADGLGPVHQARGCPLQVPLMRLGPVIVD